jgi:glycerol-3-phosphate dehydrogenase (NAD(P)+)
MNLFKKVAVLGGGSWGTALAIKLALRYQVTNIYLRQEAIIHEINNDHTNNDYLRGVSLPLNLQAYNLEDFQGEEDLIIMASASSSLMEYINIIKAKLQKSTFILIASKGFDYEGKNLFVTSLQKIINNKIGVLGGPNFALEVAMNYPSATSIAFENLDDAKFVADSISTDNFVAIPSNNIVTIQIAGCVKNIVAIACGILEGLRYAENTKAWLIVKSLEEISILTNFFNSNEKVDVASVGVIGDVILTSYSLMSRNTKFGLGLATAKNATKYLNSINYLVEGVAGAKFLSELAHDNNLNLPIVETISEILNAPNNIAVTIKKLFR